MTPFPLIQLTRVRDKCMSVCLLPAVNVELAFSSDRIHFCLLLRPGTIEVLYFHWFRRYQALMIRFGLHGSKHSAFGLIDRTLQRSRKGDKKLSPLELTA
jgi:hypothetical protein